jgi:hypothetical protein
VIGLILFGVGFALGMLAGQGKLIPWVWGVVGKARGVVFGSRPAQTFATGIFAKSPDGNTEIASAQPDTTSAVMGHKKPISADNGPYIDHYEPDIQPDTKLGQFTQTPPKPPITASKAVANVLGFFGGLLTWCARNPIVAVGLVLILAYFVIRPFDLGKSRGEVRRDAQRNEQTLDARNETTLAGAEEGERFRNDARDIQDELERGNAALESVPRETSDLDFLIAWRDADSRLLDAGSDDT